MFQLKTYSEKLNDLLKFKGKTIVVFGGLSGIGKAVCDIALKYGANIYPFSRRNGVDITDVNTLKRAFNQVYLKEHKIDYVINTAGVLNYGGINERITEDIEKEIKTNYLGCINVAQAAFEYLKETKGSLLFYSSSSYTRGRKNYAVYSSSKAAVVNLTQALAEEWENYRINVNVIVPERTATEMRLKNFGKEPEESLLSADYVAEVSLNSLLEDVTGQIITVSRTAI